MSSRERVPGYTTVNVSPTSVDGYQVILDKESGAITPLNHEEGVSQLPPPFSTCGAAEIIDSDQETARTLADRELGLYGVFDDIEGTDASIHVSRAVKSYYREDPATPLSLDEAVVKVESAFQRAREQSRDDDKTAASLVKLEEINGQMYAVWAHAGRSRIYIFTKDSELIQLTKDQGITNRAVNWIGKRASGIKDAVDYVALKPEDRIMICNGAVTDGFSSRQPRIEDFKTALAVGPDLNEQSERFLSRSETRDTSKAVVMVQLDAERDDAEEGLGGRFDRFRDRFKIFNGKSLFEHMDDAAVQYGHMTAGGGLRRWIADRKGERLKKRNVIAVGLGIAAVAAAAYVLGHDVLNGTPRSGHGANITGVSSGIVDVPSHKSPPSAPKVIPDSSGSGVTISKEVSLKVSAGDGTTDVINDYAKKNGISITPRQSYGLSQYLDKHNAINHDNTYRMPNGDLGINDPHRPLRVNLEKLKDGLKSLKRGFRR